MTWDEALATILPLLLPPFDENPPRWALIGSAATAIHRVAIVPNDIDLLARTPEMAFAIAAALESFAPDDCAAPPGLDWFSSRRHAVNVGPDDYGFVWHFGRWFVGGVKVEAAHIEPPDGFPVIGEDGTVWEAGPALWPHVTAADFHGHRVPVAPLVIQLGTCRARGLTDRAAAILAKIEGRK